KKKSEHREVREELDDRQRDRKAPKKEMTRHKRREADTGRVFLRLGPELLHALVDRDDLRLEPLDARRRRSELDELVADRLRLARDAIAHFHANAIGPLAKRFGTAGGENLLSFERGSSRDVVSRQTLAGPLRG